MSVLKVWLLLVLFIVSVTLSFATARVYGSEVSLGQGNMSEKIGGRYGDYVTHNHLTTLLSYRHHAVSNFFWGVQHTSQTIGNDKDTGENLIFGSYQVKLSGRARVEVASGVMIWGARHTVYYKPTVFISWRGGKVAGFRPRIIALESKYIDDGIYRSIYAGLEYEFN